MERPKAIEIGGLTASTMPDRPPKGESFYWRARRKGAPRDTLWTGWGTREEVSVELAKLVGKGLPLPASSRVDAARTAGEVLSLWVGHQEKRKEAGDIAPKSFRLYQHNARYSIAAFGDVRLSTLGASHLEDAALTWRLNGLGPRSINYALMIVRMAMKWARKRKCDAPLLDDVEMVKIDGYIYLSATPTMEQLEVMFGEIDEESPTGKVIRLMAWTGARPGEIATAKISDVDLDAGTLTLHGADLAQERTGKTGSRIWHIGNGRLRDLLTWLTWLRHPDDYLVPRRGLALAENLDKAIKRACKRAKIPEFTPHAIRRCAIMASLPYADAKTLADNFGHSVETMMRVYVRPTLDDRAAAIERAGLDRGPRVVSIGARAQRLGTRRLRLVKAWGGVVASG